MAIESSNRSPSPMLSRQNVNPNIANSRNREGGIRRSSSGSPFSKSSVVAHPSAWCCNSKTTSANSPADHAKRNSFSKESGSMGWKNNEYKENKNLNPISKVSKGTKNFMSPTISAVSKVAPSPRKKVLAERNETVRTSASLSDGKFLFFGGPGDASEKCEKKKVSLDDDVVLCPEEMCDFDADESESCRKKKVTFDDDVVVLSPEVVCDYDADEPFEVKPFDADEPFEVKPFDLTENEETSSPLPIAPLDADPFLPSYDPNTNFLSPRPQFLRYNPNRKVALEVSLSSETSSHNDMESTIDSVQEEESLASSAGEEEVKVESFDASVQIHKEEISDVSEIADHLEEEEPSDEDETQLFTRWRTITWLLFFGAVALLSSMIVINAPPESGSFNRMRILSAKYLPMMLSSFSETNTDFVPSQFLNSSAFVCDARDNFVEIKAPESNILPEQQVDYTLEDTVSDLEAPGEEIVVQSKPQLEEAELLKPDDPTMEQFNAIYGTSLQIDIESRPHSNALRQPDREYVSSEQPASEGVVLEEPRSVDLATEQSHFMEQIDAYVLEETNTVDKYGKAEGLLLESLQSEGSASTSATVVVVSLCVSTVFSILTLLSVRKKKVISTGAADMLTRKEYYFCENRCHESQFEGEDMDAEIYQRSEMSSYSFDDKRESRGAESKERKRNYKRESLASSSSEYTNESASYGSFTTYSIRSIKNGDEEIVTPVRRSSRLRQQHP